MKKLHTRLMQRSSWYARWHEHPQHRTMHYSLLLIFCIIMFGTLWPASHQVQSSNSSHKAFADLRFHERMNGRGRLCGSEAVNGLGQDIARVARHYGLGDRELRELLLTDRTVCLSPDALIFFSEAELPQEVSLGSGLPTNPTPDQIPDSQVFSLHSKPNASAKILLDFDGAVTQNTSWNWNGPIVSEPFSWDSDPAFSPAELDAIKKIWRNVSEDYAPFNIDVTTQEGNLVAGNYIRVIISPSHLWYGNAGGVAFLESFKWNDHSPAFVFTQFTSNGVETNIMNVKNIAEATSHEAGHTLSLYHVSVYDTNCTKLNEYYGGNGAWAPIMGVGYYSSIIQWVKTAEWPILSGPSCSQEQDDVTKIMQFGGLSAASDEAGSSASTSGNLNRTISNGVAVIDHLGVLSKDDVDVYKLDAQGGDIQITVNPMTPAGAIIGNADFRVRLLDSNFVVIEESNPQFVAAASVSKIGAANGRYYLEITSSGNLDVSQPNGYTANGSIGQYQVTGTYTSSSSGDSINPTTSITSPATGATVSGNITIHATASDNIGITKVEFYLDGALIGTDTSGPQYTNSWNTASASNGSHALTARGYDAAGNVGISTTVTVTVNNATGGDTIAPTVTIASPQNNAQIGNSVTISASATDNVKVARLEILVNNVVVAQTTKKSSLNYKWSTRSISAGTHTITARATDPSGNVGTMTISVIK